MHIKNEQKVNNTDGAKHNKNDNKLQPIVCEITWISIVVIQSTRYQRPAHRRRFDHPEFDERRCLRHAGDDRGEGR